MKFVHRRRFCERTSEGKIPLDLLDRAIYALDHAEFVNFEVYQKLLECDSYWYETDPEVYSISAGHMDFYPSEVGYVSIRVTNNPDTPGELYRIVSDSALRNRPDVNEKKYKHMEHGRDGGKPEYKKNSDFFTFREKISELMTPLSRDLLNDIFISNNDNYISMLIPGSNNFRGT